MRLAIVAFHLALLLGLTPKAADTERVLIVGPGQAYAEPHQIPKLQAGDSVVIVGRAAPYRSKLQVPSGVKIKGTPGPAGERVVFDARNAVEAPWATYWSSQVSAQGIISVTPAAGQSVVKGVTISGITFTGCRNANTGFTSASGAARGWPAAAAGVALYRCQDVTFENCTFTDCDNGVFGKSSDDWGPDGIIRNTKFTGCTFSECGISGWDRVHNCYLEGINNHYEFCNFYRPKAGSGGCNLKDRGAGTTIRYCYLEGGARTIDLVDPEDGAPTITADPRFGRTDIYGCVIVNPASGGSATMIHFGFDGMAVNAQKRLFFNANTLVSKWAQVGATWYMYPFKTDSNQEIYVSNSIFHGFTNDGSTPSEFRMVAGAGCKLFLRSTYLPTWAVKGDATVDGWDQRLHGASPSFVNQLAIDLRLKPDSPCIGKATAELPWYAPVPTHTYDPTVWGWKDRTAATDLGGIQLTGEAPPPPVEKVHVPNVVGKTLEQAMGILGRAGLVGASVSVAGTVETQTPAAGAQADKGSIVTLTVKGVVVPPPVEKVTVPNVVGQTLAQAKAIITRAGLVPASPSTDGAAIVQIQVPAAGASVDKGAVVRLAVKAVVPPPVDPPPDGELPPLKPLVFTETTPLFLGNWRAWPWGVLAFDADGDGKNDLLISQHTQDSRLYRNMGNGVYQYSTWLPVGNYRPIAWDFDQDGKLDVFGREASGSQTAQRNQGGTFAGVPCQYLEGEPSLTVCKTSGNVLTHDYGKFTWDGGKFVKSAYLNPVEAAAPESIKKLLADAYAKKTGTPTVAADPAYRFFRSWWVDGGSVQALAGFSGYSWVRLGRYLVKDAAGAWQDKTAELGLPADGTPIAAGDWNRDGKPDWLVTGRGYYMSQPDGKYALQPKAAQGQTPTLTDVLQNVGVYVHQVHVTDFNADKRPDIVVVNPRGMATYVFHGLDGGQFKQVMAWGTWDGEPVSICDFDNDGLPDLAVGVGSHYDPTSSIRVKVFLTKPN